MGDNVNHCGCRSLGGQAHTERRGRSRDAGGPRSPPPRTRSPGFLASPVEASPSRSCPCPCGHSSRGTTPALPPARPIPFLCWQCSPLWMGQQKRKAAIPALGGERSEGQIHSKLTCDKCLKEMPRRGAGSASHRCPLHPPWASPIGSSGLCAAVNQPPYKTRVFEPSDDP